MIKKIYYYNLEIEIRLITKEDLLSYNNEENRNIVLFIICNNENNSLRTYFFIKCPLIFL